MTDKTLIQTDKSDARAEYKAPELTVLDADQTESSVIFGTPEAFSGTQS